MSLLKDEVIALEYIFNSKSEDNDTLTLEQFVEILKVIYHGVSYENFIQDTLRFAVAPKGVSSDGQKHYDEQHAMGITKFVALIEMVYMKEKSPYPIAVALITILEELRIGYETGGKGGDYIEAGNTQQHIDNLISSETQRRKDLLLSKQKRSMNSLQNAHNEQYMNYKEEWENFFQDFEQKAENALNSMKQKHSFALENYQLQLEKEAQSKPPLWSKELKEFKKRERILAYQENYAEAQRVKVVADALEKDEEEKTMAARRDGSIARKEVSFRQRQDAELQVLTKKITSQRDSNLKKRDSDFKILLQRNRNIQDTLKSKQAIECNQQFEKIEIDVQKEISEIKAKLNLARF